MGRCNNDIIMISSSSCFLIENAVMQKLSGFGTESLVDKFTCDTHDTPNGSTVLKTLIQLDVFFSSTV